MVADKPLSIDVWEALGVVACSSKVSIAINLACWYPSSIVFVQVYARIQLLGLLWRDCSLLGSTSWSAMCCGVNWLHSIALSWAFDSVAWWNTWAHSLGWLSLSIGGSCLRCAVATRGGRLICLDSHLLLDVLMALLSDNFSPCLTTRNSIGGSSTLTVLLLLLLIDRLLLVLLRQSCDNRLLRAWLSRLIGWWLTLILLALRDLGHSLDPWLQCLILRCLLVASALSWTLWEALGVIGPALVFIKIILLRLLRARLGLSACTTPRRKPGCAQCSSDILCVSKTLLIILLSTSNGLIVRINGLGVSKLRLGSSIACIDGIELFWSWLLSFSISFTVSFPLALWICSFHFVCQAWWLRVFLALVLDVVADLSDNTRKHNWCVSFTFNEFFLNWLQWLPRNHVVIAFLWNLVSSTLVLHGRYIFKVFKCDHHCCNIVQGLGVNTFMQYLVHCKAWFLMNWNWATCLKNILINILSKDMIVVEIASGSFPGSINTLLIVKLFKHTVAAQKDEIVIVPYLEAFDIRGWDDALWIPTVSWVFGLNISNCPGNW